jgi:hypothetical protein
MGNGKRCLDQLTETGDVFSDSDNESRLVIQTDYTRIHSMGVVRETMV